MRVGGSNLSAPVHRILKLQRLVLRVTPSSTWRHDSFTAQAHANDPRLVQTQLQRFAGLLLELEKIHAYRRDVFFFGVSDHIDASLKGVT